MAKFTLFPTGNPDDVLAGKPVIVDVPQRSSAAGAFRLAENSFLPDVSRPVAAPDPFGDDLPTSAVAGFEKIKLAPLTARDDFAGIGNDVAPSGSARFGNLAATETESYFDLPNTTPGHQAEPGFVKSDGGSFQKFHLFAKLVEDGDHNPMVWGLATHEDPDSDNEICSYEDAKEAYQEWSHAAHKRTTEAGQEPSLGNVRLQHGTEIGGKVVKVVYDDDNKRIMLGSVPLNDQVLSDLRKGFYTGYSQGGSYAWRSCTDCGKSLTLQQANNFCPACNKSVPVRFGLKRLSEVSYVDSPCTGKGFEYVKSDGSTRFVNFTKRTEHSRPASGIELLNSVRIFGDCWKHVVKMADRKRIVVMRGDNIVLVV